MWKVIPADNVCGAMPEGQGRVAAEWMRWRPHLSPPTPAQDVDSSPSSVRMCLLWECKYSVCDTLWWTQSTNPVLEGK